MGRTERKNLFSKGYCAIVFYMKSTHDLWKKRNMHMIFIYSPETIWYIKSKILNWNDVLVIGRRTMESNYKPKYPVQTLEKSIDILLCLKEAASSEGMSIAELNERLDMGKSVIHRILDTLYSYKFVEKTGTGYRLGWGLYDVAQAVLQTHNLNEGIYGKVMERLCNQFLETVNLGICSDGEVIIICKIEPTRRLRSSVEVGEREPLYATALGKQFLASFSMEEIQNYFEVNPIKKLTEHTIVNIGEMYDELKKVKEQGYSIDDMEYCEGLICTAAPILDYRKKTIAALSISVPEGRYTDEKKEEIIKELKDAAMELSSFMGYPSK